MSTCTKTFLWQRLLHFPINGYKIEKPVLAVLGVSKNCTILHKKEYYKLQKIAHQYNSLDVIKKVWMLKVRIYWSSCSGMYYHFKMRDRYFCAVIKKLRLHIGPG